MLALLADGAILLFDQTMAQQLLAATGFTDGAGTSIAAFVIGSSLLYAFPAPAALGAALSTASLGGAICAHFRLEGFGTPPQLISLLLRAGQGGEICALCRNPVLAMAAMIAGR